MTEAALETVLRRDRAVVLLALLAIVALAWAYIVHLAAMPPETGSGGGPMDMPAMSMDGMRIVDMSGPALSPWDAADFTVMFLMWAVMMVGMMLPSAAPMILIYAGVARHAAAKGRPFAAATWFAAGYLLTWIGFAFVATAAQWGLEIALLLTPATASVGTAVGGGMLVAAGVYQWTPLKESCLSQCQAPFAFIQRHGGLRREPFGALALGMRHGLYCIGCCWALMTLLFVGGVMNLLWIAGITIFVLVEKNVRLGPWLARVAGVVLAALGAVLVVSALVPSQSL